MCMCGAEKRGENTGRERGLGTWSKQDRSKQQLSANQPPRGIKSRLGGAQHSRGAKISCHTTGVALDKTLRKELALTWVCCCEGLRVSRARGKSG